MKLHIRNIHKIILSIILILSISWVLIEDEVYQSVQEHLS